MKYAVRLGLGAALGLCGVAALAFFVDAWWIVALVGALFATCGFLGSFFIWSADRPDEGYEQVLFDVPNSAVTGGLLLAMVGLAFGASAALGGDAPTGPQLPPDEAAAVATMTEQQAALQVLFVAYPEGAKDAAKVLAWKQDAAKARDVVEKLTVPARLKTMHDALKAEASGMLIVLEAQDKCLAGDTGACVDARVGFADVQRAEKAYFAAAKELGAL